MSRRARVWLERTSLGLRSLPVDVTVRTIGGEVYHCTFFSLDIDGAPSTTVLGLNAAGDYCGAFDDGSGVMQGFVNIDGQLTTFAIPGASFTSANAINERASATGVYQLGDTNNHGFVRDGAGNVAAPIDYPGATSTILRGINKRGWIAGGYIDAQLVQHGFVFHAPNTFLS